jgi:outer membrane cobalamin receptor
VRRIDEQCDVRKWLDRRFVAIAIPAVFCARFARADEDPVSIVVTGSAESGFSSSASEGARPRETADAAALFDGLPGVRVRRLGAEGTFSTLSIRGATSNQVAVVLAGVPLTGAADPSFDLATLPLWPGASVHAYRTFAPASIGGGYLGGVAVIDPIASSNAPTSTPHTEVYDSVGSFGALRMRVADVRSIGGGWKVATGLSAGRADDDFAFVDPTGGPGKEIDSTRKNSAFAQIGGIVQARRDVDAWTLLVTALASDRRDGVAGTFERPTNATRLFRDRELFAVEARHGDDAGRWLVRAWTRRDGQRFEDPFGEEGGLGLAGVARQRTDAFGATLGRSLRFGETSPLVIDLRLEEELEDAHTVSTLDVEGTRRRTRLGAAVDATWKPIDAWSIVAAARADLRRDVDVVASKEDEILPAAHWGLEYRPIDGLSLLAHGGAVARPPSFIELLGDGGAIEAAPGLKSEHALAIDGGARAQGSMGALRWNAELVGYALRMTDLIVVLPRGVGTLRAENVGDATAFGTETSLGAELGPLRIVASHTLLVTKDRSTDAAARGNPLPGRPEHDLTLDLLARIDRLTLRYGLDVVSSTTLDRAATITVPTRTWHTIGATFTITREIKAIGEIANVFDQRSGDVVYASGPPTIFARYPISDFVGYPIPGRRWTIAVRGTL